MADKGHCKHGEFDLGKGCAQCVAERQEVENATNIVKVKYAEGSREYSYYSEDHLKVGDIIMVPVKGSLAKGMVTEVNVAESEVEAFKDKVKTIPANSGIPSEDAKVNSPENIRKRIVEASGAVKESSLAMEQLGQTFEKVADVLQKADLEVYPGTVLVKIDPGTAPSFAKHLDSARRMVEIAASRGILTEADAKGANDDLTVMLALKTAVEEERRSFTNPLNGYVNAINAAYKLITGPLLEAEQITRKLLTAYKVEQQKKVAEAEKLNQDAIDLARRQAEASGTGEFTVEVKPIPVPYAPKLTRTDQGTSGLKDVWKYRIVDIDKLPREYMVPDDAMLTSIAKKHHDKKQVAGVEFYNEPIITVRAR